MRATRGYRINRQKGRRRCELANMQLIDASAVAEPDESESLFFSHLRL